MKASSAMAWTSPGSGPGAASVASDCFPQLLMRPPARIPAVAMGMETQGIRQPASFPRRHARRAHSRVSLAFVGDSTESRGSPGHGAGLRRPDHLVPTIIQTAIAIIMRFSVSEMKPSGTLLPPPTQAQLRSRFST